MQTLYGDTYLGVYFDESHKVRAPHFGAAIAVGDYNGDHYADLVVGAPADDVGPLLPHGAGSVTVISGYNYESLQEFYGHTENAHAGAAVAVADVDGVGKAAVIVGAPDDDDVAHKTKDTGSVSVYGSVLLAGFKAYGSVASARLGVAVAGGDINRDGHSDVLAGAPGDNSGAPKAAGSVTVFFADATPAVKKYGAVANAGLGNSVAAGDVNGDGFADIIAGASTDDKPGTKVIKDAGSVSVWNGNDYTALVTEYGDKPKDFLGTAVASGDINSDGKDDLIIGIPGKDVVAGKPLKDAGSVSVRNNQQ
jgi:hypothetical protein